MKPRSPEDAYTGDRIREARLSAKLTQSDLGRKLGVSFQQVQKFEKGVNRPSSAQFVELAKISRGGLSFFFPGSEAAAKSRADPALSKFLASREGMLLARNFLHLKPEARTLLIGLVQHLAEERNHGRHRD
jgi:transcriptional regulator with XRE-family HTH domain